jgi:hypothetical protein
MYAIRSLSFGLANTAIQRLMVVLVRPVSSCSSVLDLGRTAIADINALNAVMLTIVLVPLDAKPVAVKPIAISSQFYLPYQLLPYLNTSDLDIVSTAYLH